MRGARRPRPRRRAGQRIIPAHAGSTKAMLPKAPLGWDHPRACGEHFIR
ncbi:hypothetical protein HMPREF0762_00442 [Slackia exigua ATCC 700122]|nr:hypothetical protein HMPREF0762_00442 [Slackia exigua ATCC 700122]